MRLIASCLLVLALTGCSSLRLTHDFQDPLPAQKPTEYVSGLVKNAQAVDFLAKHLLEHGLEGGPVLVGTLSNVNAMGASSTFGRALTEQMSSRLANRGIVVLEPRLRETMAFTNSGEFVLTREADEVAVPSVPVTVVATGTYSVGSEEVTVHLKLVDAKTQVVLQGISYAMTRKEYDRLVP